MKKKIILLLCVCSVFLTTISVGQINTIDYTCLLNTPVPGRKEVVETYLTKKKEIDKRQHLFIEEYNSLNNQQKDSLIHEAKIYLENQFLSEIIPAWVGTAWTFGGYTNFPKIGSIACGWFVQRIMEHLNFTFEKHNSGLPYFAQNWPKTMVLGCDSNAHIIIEDIDTVKYSKVLGLPKGIYLIGFAKKQGRGNHIGFIVNTGFDLRIIHSLGEVKIVEALEEPFFLDSEKLYIAQLFNDELITNWMRSKPIEW